MAAQCRGAACCAPTYFRCMLALRIIVGLGLAYTLLLLVAWLFQDRLAFPAPRAKLPDPKRLGVENGERVELVSGDGTKLVDRKSTRLNSSHTVISYAVFCLK